MAAQAGTVEDVHEVGRLHAPAYAERLDNQLHIVSPVRRDRLTPTTDTERPMKTSTLSRLADNVGDVVHDAFSTSKEFVADLASTAQDKASTAADKAPELADRVGSLARTGVERAPDVGRRVSDEVAGWATGVAALTPWGRRRQRKSLIRRVAPWAALIAVVATVAMVLRKRSCNPSVTDDQYTGGQRGAGLRTLNERPSKSVAGNDERTVASA